MITFRLVNLLVGQGLFHPTHQIGNTLFGIKPPGADFARFDQDACDRVIAEVERERNAALGGPSA